MLVLPEVKRPSGRLWLSGVNRLTVCLSLQDAPSASRVSRWLMPWRMIREEENYASRFIESMYQKEPQLKMVQLLSLDFYRMLKTKYKYLLNQGLLVSVRVVSLTFNALRPGWRLMQQQYTKR